MNVSGFGGHSPSVTMSRRGVPRPLGRRYSPGGTIIQRVYAHKDLSADRTSCTDENNLRYEKVHVSDTICMES